MAASISSIGIPSLSNPNKLFTPPLSLSLHKCSSLVIRKPPLLCKVLSETNSSLSSIITELEREQACAESVDQELQNDDGLILNREEAVAEVADCWREIHGENDWVGLMDPVLRSELIRYGEMAQACYDAFDYDPFSKYCGSCRFTLRLPRNE